MTRLETQGAIILFAMGIELITMLGEAVVNGEIDHKPVRASDILYRIPIRALIVVWVAGVLLGK